MSTQEYSCTHSGCGYTAKTKGAITGHINKAHAEDPLTKLRNNIPGAPRPGGVYNDRPMKVAPSGVPSIDYAIGIGGIPRGAIAEIFGPSKSGKTFTALTFSAEAQRIGQRAGYMNAEQAPMETFLPLIPGLDIAALVYGEPPRAAKDAPEKERTLWDGSGEATLEASRRFIGSGEFGVFTIDSVHSLTPRQSLSLPIGAKEADAGIARMLSKAIPVMEHEIHDTQTLVIFVNHVKDIPQAKFGRSWSKPGGSALDYYCSIQLHVTMGKPYYRKEDGRRIGHVVKVKVHKSKVALPHASAEYDLFYGEGTTKADEDKPSREVVPGIDILSSWISVLKDSSTIRWAGNRYVDINGEAIGSEADVRETLMAPASPLMEIAREVVYPTKFRFAPPISAIG